MGGCMKWMLFFLVSLGSLRGQDAIVEKPSPEVAESAVKAVEDLGKEVVMGRYKVAMDRMYPEWMDRTAKRMGGMDALQKQLSMVSEQMLQQGISIIDFRPEGEPRVFEVSPGKRVAKVDGQEIEQLIYTKWMLLVPTLTKFRVFLEQDPKPITIESTGFQVAVSDKGKNDWTFIDGSGVTVNELRALFGNLPLDLELPPLEKKQIK